jgi:DNA repair exonuclease SbcCD ATPase subunit
LLKAAGLHCAATQTLLCAALTAPPVCSTPHSAGAPNSSLDALHKQLEELSARVEQLEVITQDTESNVVGVYDKLDELSSAVAAQETAFNKRLADALAQLRAEATESQSLVAELCAKVQSQEAQLQQLMEKREAEPVQVESSAVAGAPATRGILSRAAKAAGF